jgi:hypothetical protein
MHGKARGDLVQAMVNIHLRFLRTRADTVDLLTRSQRQFAKKA